jgi:PLP dependent protein
MLIMNIAGTIERLSKQTAQALQAAGRSDDSVALMAVTKNHGPEAVQAALEAGVVCFGENRVQEAVEKYAGHPAQPYLHIIGHLQSNKVRKAVELADWIDSVDSRKLLDRIERTAAELDKRIEVLFEFNISREAAKSGFEDRESLFSVISAAAAMKHVVVRGLMTIGPLTDDDAAVRADFKAMRVLFEEVQRSFPACQIDVLSMGMSGDWRIAVEEGSTMIRLGTAIFGERQYR